MKLSLADILNASQGLALTNNKELPVKCSYLLSRVQIKLNEPIKSFEESRNKLVTKYGTIQEDKTIKVPDDKMEDFSKEINELLKTEEDISISPLSLSLFDGQNLSKEFFILLDKLIIE